MKTLLGFLVIITCFTLIIPSCQKEFSIETGADSIVATGTLYDSLNACMPDSVHGTYYNGVTPGNDTAFVDVQVNVTQTGTYSISSDLQNGFEFVDSGFFNTTGLNTIHLKAIGTPILQQPTIFNISFDSSFCTFTINVQDSTGTGLGGHQDTTGTGGGDSTQLQTGTWQFTQGSFTYQGTIDSASKDNSSGLATFLYLSGSTSTADTILSIQFIITAADIQPGTYTTNDNAILFSVIAANASTPLYTASLLDPGTSLTLVVTSYDSSTRIMQGTFSGNAKDQSGNIVPITNGSFTATVSP